MRLAVVPAAGRASRMGKKAPLGCKLLVTLPGGVRMGHYLQTLLEPHVDEVRFVVQENVRDDARLNGLNIYSTTGRSGPLKAVHGAGGMEADDLLVWYADTLADSVPPGTDWVAVSWPKLRRSWELRAGTTYIRKIAGPDTMVTAGAYRFSNPGQLQNYTTMLDALNEYPLEEKFLHGWLDLDDVAITVDA